MLIRSLHDAKTKYSWIINWYQPVCGFKYVWKINHTWGWCGMMAWIYWLSHIFEMEQRPTSYCDAVAPREVLAQKCSHFSSFFREFSLQDRSMFGRGIWTRTRAEAYLGLVWIVHTSCTSRVLTSTPNIHVKVFANRWMLTFSMLKCMISYIGDQNNTRVYQWLSEQVWWSWIASYMANTL